MVALKKEAYEKAVQFFDGYTSYYKGTIDEYVYEVDYEEMVKLDELYKQYYNILKR